MCEGIIQKNFANFSAWHYRGKLLPQMYINQPDSLYSIPIDRVKGDLEMLKNAFYTDPKDQGSWNYHEWLIQQLTPVQVVAMKYERGEDQDHVLVGLSQKMRNFEKLEIKVMDEEGNNLDFSVSTNEAGQRGISSCWKISIASVKDEKKLLTLSIKMPKLAGKNIS